MTIGLLKKSPDEVTTPVTRPVARAVLPRAAGSTPSVTISATAVLVTISIFCSSSAFMAASTSAAYSVPRCLTGEYTSRSPWRAARSDQWSKTSLSTPKRRSGAPKCM